MLARPSVTSQAPMANTTLVTTPKVKLKMVSARMKEAVSRDATPRRSSTLPAKRPTSASSLPACRARVIPGTFIRASEEVTSSVFSPFCLRMSIRIRASVALRGRNSSGMRANTKTRRMSTKASIRTAPDSAITLATRPTITLVNSGSAAYASAVIRVPMAPALTVVKNSMGFSANRAYIRFWRSEMMRRPRWDDCTVYRWVKVTPRTVTTPAPTARIKTSEKDESPMSRSMTDR